MVLALNSGLGCSSGCSKALLAEFTLECLSFFSPCNSPISLLFFSAKETSSGLITESVGPASPPDAPPACCVPAWVVCGESPEYCSCSAVDSSGSHRCTLEPPAVIWSILSCKLSLDAW